MSFSGTITLDSSGQPDYTDFSGYNGEITIDCTAATSLADSAFKDNTTFESAASVSFTGITQSGFELGASCFQGSTLTSISIASNIETIGDYALMSSRLETITFEENSTLEMIGVGAFRQTWITSITIPASVTTIDTGAFAFSRSWSIQQQPFSLTFESSSQLVSIGQSSFRESGITNITFPASLQSIANFAFLNSTLQTATFEGDLVTSIGSGAFNTTNSLNGQTWSLYTQYGATHNTLTSHAWSNGEPNYTFVIPAVDPVVLTALADQAQSHFDEVANQDILFSTHTNTAAQIVGAKDLTTIVGIQTTKSQLETLKAAVQTNIDAREQTVIAIGSATWMTPLPGPPADFPSITNWSDYLTEPLTGYDVSSLVGYQLWVAGVVRSLDSALLISINATIQNCDDALLVLLRRPQPMVFVMDGGDEVSSAQTVETYDRDLVDDEYVQEGSKFHAVFVPETAVPLSTIFTPLVKASSFDLDNIDVDTQTSIRSACVKTLAAGNTDDEYHTLEVALEEVNDILAYCIDSTLKESSSDQASFFNLMSSMCMAAIYGGTDRALNWGEETLHGCRTFGDATLCAAHELSVPLDWSGDTEFSGAFNAIVRNKNDILKGYAFNQGTPKQVYENIFSNALVLDAAKSAMVGTGNLQNQLGAPPQAEYETTPIDEATYASTKTYREVEDSNNTFNSSLGVFKRAQASKVHGDYCQDFRAAANPNNGITEFGSDGVALANTAGNNLVGLNDTFKNLGRSVRGCSVNINQNGSAFDSGIDLNREVTTSLGYLASNEFSAIGQSPDTATSAASDTRMHRVTSTLLNFQAGDGFVVRLKYSVTTHEVSGGVGGEVDPADPETANDVFSLGVMLTQQVATTSGMTVLDEVKVGSQPGYSSSRSTLITDGSNPVVKALNSLVGAA